MTLRSTLIILISVAMGCGGSGDDAGDSADASPDDLLPPPECALTAPPDDFVYPSGPYGSEQGDLFENISLSDCDGNTVNFGDILAQAELTLFNIGAGWCQPCVEESETLDDEIFRPFCGRGLRVVQVLFQDDQAEAATSLFCRDWRDQFGLSFPVLIDPLFETQKYFESVQSQTPINFLIDASGEIVFKETGTPAADLPQRIDQLLPASP